MDNDHTVHIGMRQVYGGEQPFGLRAADRRHHTYTIGKTGCGKTTMLRNLILQDIEAGQGVGVIDPHGDLASDLLDHIPPWRTDDVVYFNPADLEFPIGFNLLQSVPADSRHLVVSSVVGIFKAIWKDSWGPRLEYLLYCAVASLLECQNTSLLGLQRIFVDEDYRRWVVKQVKDPLVRSFWLDEFGRYDKRFLQEAIAPIQNKVGQLLTSPPVRNILGQVKSKFDPRFMMDNRRILIANLSKGALGEDKTNLMGAILVSKFQLAAMSRANVPEEKRPNFFLFIDEFFNFTTESFAGILSEARKYGLCLTLSHQYMEQLDKSVREAVLGNVGTIVAFRVGHQDADVLEQEFGASYRARHFTELANHQVCVKLLEGAETGEPFTGRTVPPTARHFGRRENLIRRSREKYANSRTNVEHKIGRWLNS